MSLYKIKRFIREKSRILAILLFIFLTIAAGLTAWFWPNNTDTRSEASGTTLPAYTSTVWVGRDNGNMPISPYLWGVNFPGYSIIQDYKAYLTAEQFLQDYTAENMSEMGVKLIRFPGGCHGDAYNWGDGTSGRIQFEQKSMSIGDATSTNITVDEPFMSVDELMKLKDRLGVEINYQIKVEDEKYPVEKNSCGQIAKQRGSVEEAKAIVRKYGNRIKYFSLGNEQAFNTNPAKYRDIVLRYATAMRQVNPNIKIIVNGGTIAPEAARVPWLTMMSGLLAERCGTQKCVDFVDDHYYSDNISTSVDGVPVKANTEIALDHAYFKAAAYGNTPRTFGEWNASSSCADSRPLGSVEQGLFTVDMMFKMAEQDFPLASYYKLDVLEDGVGGKRPYRCGTHAGPGQLAAAGQAYAFLAPVAGGSILSTSVDTDAPRLWGQCRYSNGDCFQNIKMTRAYSAKTGSGATEKVYTYILNNNPARPSKTKVYFTGVDINPAATKATTNTFTSDTAAARRFQNPQSGSAVFSSDNGGNFVEVTVPPMGVMRVELSQHQQKPPANETYGGNDLMLYVRDGQQIVRQAYLTADGKKMISRDCKVDLNANQTVSAYTKDCSAFSETDLAVLTGIAGETYSGYATFLYDTVGVTKVRQSLVVNGGRTLRYRLCTINKANGALYDCSNFETFDLSTQRGVGNESYLDYTFLYSDQGSKKVLRQTFLAPKVGDKQLLYFRTCDWNAASSAVSNCTTFEQYDMAEARGIGLESYKGYSGVVFNTSNGTKIRQEIISADSKTLYYRTCDIEPIKIQVTNCSQYLPVNISSIYADSK
jgi:hypothetical protein